MPELYHITDLQSVDFALGALIASAYGNLAPSGTDAFNRFLARPTNKKIFRSQVDTPADIIKRIATGKKGDQPGGLPDLPLVAYYRKPGLTNGDSAYAQIHGRAMYSEDLLRSYNISLAPVALDYMVYFLAWDKPTLDRLCLAWYCYTVKPKRLGSRFIVPCKLDGEIFEVPATLHGTRDILLSDDSQASGEGRLWACSSGLTVVTQILYGRAAEYPTEIEVHGIVEKFLSHGGEG